MISPDLETSFMFLNQTFGLADILSLNIFVGIETPKGRRFWSTNSKRLQFDFMSNELSFCDGDLWLKPGKVVGEGVISKDNLFNLMTDGLTNLRSETESLQEVKSESMFSSIERHKHVLLRPLVLEDEFAFDVSIPSTNLESIKTDIKKTPFEADTADDENDFLSLSSQDLQLDDEVLGEGPLSTEHEGLDDISDSGEPDVESTLETVALKVETRRSETMTILEGEEHSGKAHSGPTLVDRKSTRKRNNPRSSSTSVGADRQKMRKSDSSKTDGKRIEAESADTGIVCRITQDGIVCGLSFASKEGKWRHYKEVHCVCPHCDRRFYMNNTMRKHIRFVHEKKRPYACELCEKTFLHQYDLRIHLAVHARKEKSKRRKKEFVPSEPRPEFNPLYNSVSKCKPTNKCKNIILKCLICRESFVTREERLRHYKEVHCTCKLCGKIFKEPSSMRKHVLAVHDKTKPHKCPKCDKTFNTATELRSHDLVHLGTKDHVCSHCGKAFARASQLANHIKYLHLKIRNYSCSLCEKSFFAPRMLKIHVKAVHRKDKDFPCQECDAKFGRPETLRQHIKAIHSQANVRPFDCLSCGKSFKLIHHLKRHVMTHGMGHIGLALE